MRRGVYARSPYRHWILMQVEQVWRHFSKRFLELWEESTPGNADMPELFTEPAGAVVFAAEKQRFMRNLFIDLVSFAGIKMIRRILGLAHTEDLESIEDPAMRAKCETKVADAGPQAYPRCRKAHRHQRRHQRRAGNSRVLTRLSKVQ